MPRSKVIISHRQNVVICKEGIELYCVRRNQAHTITGSDKDSLWENKARVQVSTLKRNMTGSNESCFGCLFTLLKFVLVRIIFIIHCFAAYFCVTVKYGIVNPLEQSNEDLILYIVSVRNLQIMAAGGFLLLIFEILLSSYLRSVDKE